MIVNVVIQKEENAYIAKDLRTDVADQGDTIEEALANLKAALELYYEGEPMSDAKEDFYVFTTIDVCASGECKTKDELNSVFGEKKRDMSPIEMVASAESHAELIDGKIVANVSTSLNHYKALRAIEKGFEKSDGGSYEVFTQTIGLYCNEILDDDSNFFLPDVMVVDKDAKVDDDGVHSAPRFVAEVTSESTIKTDYIYKMCIYGEIGVAEYWVVDLQRKRIARFLADNDFAPELFDYPNTKMLASKTYPEVEIELSELFEDYTTEINDAITEEKKNTYISYVHEELLRRGFTSEEIPRLIAKTGFMAVMEEFPKEQMHYDVRDAVDEIILTALKQFCVLKNCE